MFTLIAIRREKSSLAAGVRYLCVRYLEGLEFILFINHIHTHGALSVDNYGYNFINDKLTNDKALIGVCNQKIQLFWSFVLISNLTSMTSVIDAGMF